MIAPLRYVLSLKKRSKITVLAIAIVMMFITSTYTIAYSFELSNKDLVERFQSRYYIISSSENILNSRIASNGIRGAYAYIFPAKIDNVSTYVIAIYDPYDILGRAYQCGYDDIILGKHFNLRGNINISVSGESMQFHVIKKMKFEFFPDYWAIMNYSRAQKIQEEPNFIITDKPIGVSGLITQPMIKLADFYYRSSEETYMDLILLTLISIVVIYFFINALLNMEITESIRKISIIRALGSTSWNILGIYLLRSLYIGISGTIIGFSLGIVLSYMIPTLLQFVNMLSYFVVYIPPSVFEVDALLALVGAGLASIQPIRRAVKMNIIKGMRGGYA